jgi:hypothetical protein
MFEEVEARRRRLDAHKPFGAQMLERLDAVFEPWFIYGSNALEGNTLTLGDTIYLIREGKLPGGGKREEEYLEVKGQQAAYAYLRQAVAGKLRINEKLIREFHTLLTEKLDANKYRPGQYKNRDNQVRLADGTLFPYVSHVETPAAMRDLVRWLDEEGQQLHPVERAAALHYKFILIHPFLDGNGRTARLLTNLAILQSGHVMTVFRADERRRLYLDALRATDTSVPITELTPNNPNLNLFPFTSYVEQELLWSYDLALDVVEGRLSVTSEDLVRRFERMDQRGLQAMGIAADEGSRLEAAAEAVQRLTDRVGSQVSDIATGLNEKWSEIVARDAGEVAGARDLLDRSPLLPADPRKQLLGIEDTSLRGQAGVVSISVGRKPDNLVQMAVPRNVCEFVVYAEPHALTLASIRISGSPKKGLHTVPVPHVDTASVRLSLDPASWRDTEISRFILEELTRFLDATEAEIKRVNSAP